MPKDKDVKTRLLTFTQVENRGSRAVLNEDVENVLSALWNSGDELGCCNLSTLEEKIMNHEDISTGTLTAQYNNVRTSIFQGEMNCNQDHRLAVIYPVKNFGFGLESGEYFAKYTITLSGQDGTLEKLANSYHYMYGVATVNSVTSSMAEASGEMKSLLAVCKFSFTDGEGHTIRVKELEISYGGDGLDGDFGTYPQTANVTCNINQDTVHADYVPSNESLIIQTVLSSDSQYPKDVFVSLLPVSERTFCFKVTDANDGTYTGVAKGTLNAGEYVVATISVKREV